MIVLLLIFSWRYSDGFARDSCPVGSASVRPVHILHRIPQITIIISTIIIITNRTVGYYR